MVAAASTRANSQPLRGEALRNAARRSSDDPLDHGVSFNTYELRLPGEDKVLGNDDDFIVLDDGRFGKISEFPQLINASSTRSKAP